MSTMKQEVESITCGDFGLEEKHQFKPFDIVFESSGSPLGHVALGMILAGPIVIPSFSDGSGTDFGFKPLDVKDPAEWGMGWHAFVVHDFVREDVVLCSARHLHKLEENQMSGYIPFDHGTGKMRGVLGLLALADKFYGYKEPVTIMTRLLKKMEQE